MQESADGPFRGLDQPLLHAVDRIEQTGQEGDRRRLRAQAFADRLQLLERVLMAVHARMQARIDVAADDAAAGDHQHADQRDIAVGGAEAEIRVKQHQQRTDDAERHVDVEPDGDAAEPAQPLGALAGGIDQEQQHHRSAGDAEPIAERRSWA